MGKDTITLALNGKVSLRDFGAAIQELFNLIHGLNTDLAKGVHIEWLISDLHVGSATATAQGIAENDIGEEAIEKVVHAYLEVGEAIRHGSEINYSPPVKTAAKKLTALINGGIKSVRFETSDNDVEIFASPEVWRQMPVVAFPEEDFGAVIGRVDSLRKRGGLRFTLYDLIDDRAISCYLAVGSDDVMRAAWGKLAMVEGRVKRDRECGRATTIRDVREIRVIQEGKPGDYRQAIGAAAGFLGNMLPEEAIRKGRDG